jgi:hypothetical protein
MKKKNNELDVDTIGNQDKPLTIEEQLSISAFIKKLKESRIRKDQSRKSKIVKRTT